MIISSLSMQFAFFVLLGILFFLIFLISEYLFEKLSLKSKSFQLEIGRKAIHISTALLYILATYILNESLFIIFIIIPVIFFLFAHYFHFFKIYTQSRKEKENLGIIYYSIGLLLITLFFYTHDKTIIRIALLILGFSDAFASIIGQAYPIKQFHFFSNTKSITGSVTFFIITVIIFIFTAHSPISFSIIGSIFLMLIELSAILGIDNLFILLDTVIFFSFPLIDAVILSSLFLVLLFIYAQYYYHYKRS